MQIITSTSINQSSAYPNKNTLILHKVDYRYVGNYRCGYEKYAQEIYLFIKGKLKSISLIVTFHSFGFQLFLSDPQHPLAPVMITDLIGINNEEIEIPCKPTSIEYEVELIKMTKDNKVNLFINDPVFVN